MINQFFDAIKTVQFDYAEIIKNKTKIYNIDNNRDYDINIIIPLYKRQKFLHKVVECFNNAIIKSGSNKINITISELSDNGEDNLDFCKKNKIDYICLKTEKKMKFPKSLLMNIAALYGCKSKWFLFHDVDCLPQSNFFINLNSNINNKKSIAIQTFQKRRVLYLNNEISDDILNNKINIDDLDINHPKISLPLTHGAPGGSIMIKKEVFFEIGGYDDQLFSGYAPEDEFLWKKILWTNHRIDLCDDPPNELFHLNHEMQSSLTIDEYNNFEIMKEVFEKMNLKKKKEFIEIQKNRLNKYKNI